MLSKLLIVAHQPVEDHALETIGMIIVICTITHASRIPKALYLHQLIPVTINFIHRPR